MSNGNGTSRVLQMIACNGGWQAIFRAPDADPSDQSKRQWFMEPVVCWLLVEQDGETEVHPAVPLGTVVGDATTAANYLCVVPNRNQAEAIEAIRKIAPDLLPAKK